MSEEFPGYDGPMQTCTNPACQRTYPATTEYFYWWRTRNRLFHRCKFCGKAATRRYRANERGMAIQRQSNQLSRMALSVPFLPVLRQAQEDSLKELNACLLILHIPPVETGVDYDKGATK